MSPEQSNWDYAKNTFPPTPLIENKEIIESEPDQSQLTRRYTEKAIDFINKNKDESFFLYLPYTFPHIPLYVDEANKGKSKRGLYGDVVEVLDWSVGKILNALKKNGLDENTFVIFTSDNGPWGWAGINGGSQGLLKGKKGSLWEGGFRVPTIAWMPNTIPSNVTSDAIGTTMDLMPTFLEMAGIYSSEFDNLNGQSILETFIQNKEIQQEVFYYRNNDFVGYRNGAWKIFINDPDPWNDEFTEKDMPLLYNVNEDPSERFEVSKDYPDVVKELTRMAENHLNSVEVVPSQLDSVSAEYREKYDAYFLKK
jgi:arylsulfatase